MYARSDFVIGPGSRRSSVITAKQQSFGDITPDESTDLALAKWFEQRRLSAPVRGHGYNHLRRYFAVCEAYDSVPVGSWVKSFGDEIVNLSHLGLRDKDIPPLADAIHSNPFIKTLLLRDNGLKESSFTHLFSALNGHHTLETLDISGNKGGVPMCRALSASLDQNRSLQKLILKSCNILDGGFRLLCDALGNNYALRQLDVSANGITDAAVPSLCSMLNNNRSLKELNISWNRLMTAGITSLAPALALSALSAIDLSCNGIGDEGGAAIARALITNQNEGLERLDLSQCRLGNVAATALADAIRQTATLSSVKLERNGIGEDGARALYQALRENTTVHELDLAGCHLVSDESSIVFNVDNPTGHYKLSLENSYNRSVATRLLELEAADIGQNIFNATLNGKDMDGTNWATFQLPPTGTLELDYRSGKRPPADAAPIDQHDLDCFLKSLNNPIMTPLEKLALLRVATSVQFYTCEQAATIIDSFRDLNCSNGSGANASSTPRTVRHSMVLMSPSSMSPSLSMDTMGLSDGMGSLMTSRSISSSGPPTSSPRTFFAKQKESPKVAAFFCIFGRLIDRHKLMENLLTSPRFTSRELATMADQLGDLLTYSAINPSGHYKLNLAIDYERALANQLLIAHYHQSAPFYGMKDEDERGETFGIRNASISGVPWKVDKRMEMPEGFDVPNTGILELDFVHGEEPIFSGLPPQTFAPPTVLFPPTPSKDQQQHSQTSSDSNNSSQGGASSGGAAFADADSAPLLPHVGENSAESENGQHESPPASAQSGVNDAPLDGNDSDSSSSSDSDTPPIMPPLSSRRASGGARVQKPAPPSETKRPVPPSTPRVVSRPVSGAATRRLYGGLGGSDKDTTSPYSTLRLDLSTLETVTIGGGAGAGGSQQPPLTSTAGGGVGSSRLRTGGDLRGSMFVTPGRDTQRGVMSIFQSEGTASSPTNSGPRFFNLRDLRDFERIIIDGPPHTAFRLVRMRIHLFYFTSDFAARVVQLFSTSQHRIAIAVALFARICDRARAFYKIVTSLDEEEQSMLETALGSINMFDPEHPCRRYRLNLANKHDRIVANTLLKLSIEAEGSNWKDETLDGIPFNFSENNRSFRLPSEGILELVYLDDRDAKILAQKEREQFFLTGGMSRPRTREREPQGSEI